MSAKPNSFLFRSRRHVFVLASTVVLSVLIGYFWPFASGLKEDEELVFFPTSAVKNSDGSWTVPVHTWIFEREEDDILRGLGRKLIGELLEQFGVSEQETHSQLFRDRIKYFLVDNERGKQISVSVSSLKHAVPIDVPLQKTSANGQARTLVNYARKDVDGSWLILAAKLPLSWGQSKL